MTRKTVHHPTKHKSANLLGVLGAAVGLFAIWLAIIAIVVAVVVSTASYVWGAPPPDHAKPPIGIEVSCQPIAGTEDQIMERSTDAAAAWVRWANTSRNDLVFYSRASQRFKELGYMAGAFTVMGVSDQRKGYLAAYVITLRAAFQNDIPPDLIAAWKAGVRNGKRFAQDRELTCTEA